MKDFKNKVAAITGASSGMGRSLAVLLASRGCHVALSDINEAGLAETVKLLNGTGVKVTSQKLDVAKKDDVFAWADQVAKDHGKVNLIFNNAGVALGSAVDGGSYEDLEWIMNINFWGVVHGTKAFLPYLKDAGEGHVINTSSVFGLMGVPSQSAYNASKFAVRGFTEALRQELEMQKVNVSATSVHPGGIKTNIASGVEGGEAFADKYLKTDPADIVRQVIRCIRSGKQRLVYGHQSSLVWLSSWAMPLEKRNRLLFKEMKDLFDPRHYGWIKRK